MKTRQRRQLGTALVLAVIGVSAVFLSRRTGSLSGEAPPYRQKGPADAPVLIQEFSDFQCPRCAAIQIPLKAFLDRHGTQARLVFRHCPYPQHKWAALAAEAAECAGAQGRFWEMADRLFQTQNDWKDAADAKPFFQKLAADVNLDAARFNQDLDAGRYRALVERDRKMADAVPVTGTPTVYFNDKHHVVGDIQFEAFAERFFELEVSHAP